MLPPVSGLADIAHLQDRDSLSKIDIIHDTEFFLLSCEGKSPGPQSCTALVRRWNLSCYKAPYKLGCQFCMVVFVLLERLRDR